MARELKIPAEGGGWCRGRREEARGGLGAAVGDCLGAGDVLDEVYVVRVVVVLVQALTGGTLALELSPLWRAWLITNMWREKSVSSAGWVTAGRSEVTLNSGEKLSINW